MTRAVFQVAVGPTRPLWESCIASVAAWCERQGYEHRVLREPALCIVPIASQRSEGAMRLGYLPIFEKWNALTLLPAHDAVAVIDADVYARPDAPDIFAAMPADADFAAVVERDAPISTTYARKLDGYARGQYGDPLRRFFNCGVMLLRPSILAHTGPDPRAFITRPEFAPYVNGEGHFRWSTDQTLTNEWLAECGASAHALDWRWNGLYGMLEPGAIEQAHLVHFLLSDHLPHDAAPETLLATNRRTRV